MGYVALHNAMFTICKAASWGTYLTLPDMLHVYWCPWQTDGLCLVCVCSL